HLAEEPAQLAKEQARNKASHDREQVIEDTQRVDKAKRAEKHLAEEPAQLAKEQARNKAYLAQEKATAEAQVARKARESKKLEGK
ncbi:hypothetical protein ACFLTJ_01515, partial [Chloroflexota bacterium]